MTLFTHHVPFVSPHTKPKANLHDFAQRKSLLSKIFNNLQQLSSFDMGGTIRASPEPSILLPLLECVPQDLRLEQVRPHSISVCA